MKFSEAIPLSLYVHIPWCISKCPYCDFNSHALRQGELPEQRYVDALLADLCQLEAGYKCLGRDAVGELLKQKKDYFLGRGKQ